MLEKFKIKLNKKQEFFCMIVIPFIFVYLLMSYVFGVVVIRGDSMLPTYSDYDVVLIQRIGFIPDYGDVLVCSGDNYPIIKRVVGKEEDIISIQNNLITVNGIITAINDTASAKQGAIVMPHTVCEDSYFLIGDNSSASIDSRFSNVGDIHKTQIIGKVLIKIRGK